MSDSDVPQKMRQEVQNLIVRAAAASNDAKKRELSSLAFSIAQAAEAEERRQQDVRNGEQPVARKPVEDENFRIVAENNIRSFIERLYVETDKVQRETFRNLLLWEERWFGLKQERLEALQRLLCDCDGRVLRHRTLLMEQKASGADVAHTEIVLNNMLETQKLLHASLRKELSGA